MKLLGVFYVIKVIKHFSFHITNSPIFLFITLIISQMLYFVNLFSFPRGVIDIFFSAAEV